MTVLKDFSEGRKVGYPGGLVRLARTERAEEGRGLRR